MSKTCHKMSNYLIMCRNMSQFVEMGLNSSTYVAMCRKHVTQCWISQFVETCLNLSKYVTTCRHMPPYVELRHNLLNCVTMCRNMSKCVIMEWRRLVGSINDRSLLQKNTKKRDDIVQKRPVILWILLIVATPHVSHLLRPMSVVTSCQLMRVYITLIRTPPFLSCTGIQMCHNVQPIADKVAQNLEIISKKLSS